MSRNQIVPKILEILQAQAESTVDLLDIMTSSYHTSYRKARRSMKYGPRKFKTDWAFEYKQRQQFYSLLNQLKNQGFINKKQKTTGAKGSLWELTKKGLRKLNLKKAKNVKYKKESDNKLKVVIFDIPEKERQKRAWLRAALISMDFSLLQQSVWIGKNKLEERFLYDLRRYGVLPYVQIFEINKRGTINKLS